MVECVGASMALCSTKVSRGHLPPGADADQDILQHGADDVVGPCSMQCSRLIRQASVCQQVFDRLSNPYAASF